MINYYQNNIVLLVLFLINYLRGNKSYCNLLWDSVYIDQYGNVYTCCHYKPGIIGNLYDDSLKDVWCKGALLNKYRSESITGKLSCYKLCNILTINQKQNQFKYLLSSLFKKPTHTFSPRRIWILFSEFCNINCIMCPQDHHSQLFLSNEILQNNIDWNKVDEIELQGGEVLSTNRGREIYRWLTEIKGKKVNLITNGLLLDDYWISLIVRGSNWVEISVNAASATVHEIVNQGSDFNKVINNVTRLVDVKRKLDLSTSIIFKFTIVPENLLDIADAIILANNLGCDKIAFGYDNNLPEFLNSDEYLKHKIKDQIANAINSSMITIDVNKNRLVHLGLV
jgi:MoaA/NifB/PqqE/SkfB family radical SAM enzyme